MTLRRLVMILLSIIPVGLIVLAIVFSTPDGSPNVWGEVAALLFGLPILVLDMWEFTEPELLDKYLGRSRVVLRMLTKGDLALKRESRKAVRYYRKMRLAAAWEKMVARGRKIWEKPVILVGQGWGRIKAWVVKSLEWLRRLMKRMKKEKEKHPEIS
jgi:hypothetical protein